MNQSNAEKYNECNPRDDSYCIFEKELDDTKNTLQAKLTEIEILKEKLKFYLEPFELRPTYQELEKKISNIDRIVNTRYTYTNDNSWYQTLRKTVQLKCLTEENDA